MTDLIETGLAVPVRLVGEQVLPSLDEGEFGMRLELCLEDEQDPDIAPEDVVEWGAFGFLFVIGKMSFDDARARGNSELDYVSNDTFSLADFVGAISYCGGELRLDTDYIRGRRMKTGRAPARGVRDRVLVRLGSPLSE